MNCPPRGQWASRPPSSASVQARGQGSSTGSRSTVAHSRLVCVWHCARSFINFHLLHNNLVRWLLTSHCTDGKMGPGRGMNSLPTDARLPRRRGSTPGSMLFLLPGLRDIRGILELQAPDSQRKSHQAWIFQLAHSQPQGTQPMNCHIFSWRIWEE